MNTTQVKVLKEQVKTLVDYEGGLRRQILDGAADITALTSGMNRLEIQEEWNKLRPQLEAAKSAVRDKMQHQEYLLKALRAVDESIELLKKSNCSTDLMEQQKVQVVEYLQTANNELKKATCDLNEMKLEVQSLTNDHQSFKNHLKMI